MRMRAKMMGMGLAAVLMTMASGALAITVEGDPWDEESWNGGFNQSTTEKWKGQTVGAYSLLQLRVNDYPGDTWDPDLVLKVTFNKPGWKYTLYDTVTFKDSDNKSKTGARILVMYGPTVSAGSMNFTLSFGGKSATDPVWFSIQTYSPAGQLRQNQDATYAKNAAGKWAWTFTDNGTWTQSVPIPEPLTLAGALLGIGALGQYLRKRRSA